MSLNIVTAILTLNEAKQLARSDAKLCSRNADEFIKLNALTYYVLGNTWLLLLKDHAGYAHVFFKRGLLHDGMINMIKLLQEDADVLVHQGDVTLCSPLSQAIYREISDDRVLTDPGLNIGRSKMATMLFLLRYPKRFSPSGNDLIKEATLMEFIGVENRNKQLQRSEYSRYVINHIREEIKSLYDWSSIISEIDSMSPQDILLSSGAGFDSTASIGSKLMSLAHNHDGCGYFGHPMGVQMVDIPRVQEPPLERLVRIQAVPKSYKASRIIAMEDTYRLAKAKGIEYIFRRHDITDSSGINLADQGINQQYARIGSLDHTLATLDASHASDTITKTLFREVFPHEYVRRVEPLLGTQCVFPDGRMRTMQMLSTSGHSLTFRHETIVYKAVISAADRLTNLFTGNGDTCFSHAYGDDTICPSQSVDLAIEFYNALGMQINRDKSFVGSEDYRESCGKEYLGGEEMTSLYYPRFPIVGTISNDGISFANTVYHDEYRGKLDNSLTMLIDLQKKLFLVSREASQFVSEVVHLGCPKMTSSLYGTVCSDLWDYQDLGVLPTPLKGYAIERVKAKYGYKSVFVPRDLNRSVAAELEELHRKDTKHFSPSVSYSLPRKGVTEEQIRLYDLYRYYTFLKEGPRYASPLDELLGISEKPVSLSQIFGKRSLSTAIK